MKKIYLFLFLFAAATSFAQIPPITTLGVTDTIFLPDGINCPPYGYSYRSSVTFTSFNPTAMITNSDDILYVRLNIEHSFIGDIFIQLTCPNGNTAIIVPDYQTYHWCGITYASFGLYNPSNGESCNPADNPMGTGWDYCWSSTTNQGYTYAGGQGFVYEPVNIGDVVTHTVNPTDVANMTQVYQPFQDFGYHMNGCPFNGTWYLEVQDTWGGANGYIFGWELALNPTQAVGATYTITATAGDNGTISPSGNVSVEEATNQLFTITPSNGYLIEDVLVDDVSQGAISSYTFTNVQANHTISVSFAAGIDENNLQNTFNIYPNPANGVLNVTTTQRFEKVEITTLLGQLIYSKFITEDNFQINVSTYTAGVYFVRLIGDDGIVTKKFVKK